MVDEVSGQQTFYAGQVKIADCGTVVADSNVLVGGEDGDKAATGAVISVEAVDGGSVRNNDVWGIVSGGLDTAMSIDGAFYVFGNAYHGEHPLNTGTEFSTELDIIGTGATVGDNQMAITDGGTTTSFENVDSERWAMAGVVETKTGELEITWSTDIEVIEVEARVKVAPTGSAVIVDVHKNDTTTLYTGGTDRPEIATSTKSDITTPAITSVTAGEPVRIDIDQKDSNDVAEGLTVTIRYRRV